MSAAGTGDAARRHAAIVERTRNAGSVSVEELARALDISAQTIRKDLTLLEQRGLLSRTHGGATARSGTNNLPYAERRLQAVAEKDAIGAAAAALIENGSSLFINIGTTCEAVARHLVRHRGLMVITNNLNVVDILADCADVEVIAAGGSVRRADRAVVGAVAMDFLRNFRVDAAVIGASAIDGAGDFLDFDVDEVHVSQTIIRQARRVVLAIDATKLDGRAPVRIGGLADVDCVVIDRAPEDLRRACAAAAVTLVEVAAAGSPG